MKEFTYPEIEIVEIDSEDSIVASVPFLGRNPTEAEEDLF